MEEESAAPRGTDIGEYGTPMGGLIWLHSLPTARFPKLRLNKTDKNRIARCRSLTERYHPALNVAEILEKILSYVVLIDPCSAIWFLRALENLGMRRNAEGMFLNQKIKSSRFNRAFSVGVVRSKMLKGTHCVDCFERLRNKGLNEIDDITRCWTCFTKRHRVVSQGRARTYLKARDVGADKIKCLLSLKNSGCKEGVDGHLKRAEYMKVPHYLKEDLKKAVSQYGRRDKPYRVGSPSLLGEDRRSLPEGLPFIF